MKKILYFLVFVAFFSCGRTEPGIALKGGLPTVFYIYPGQQLDVSSFLVFSDEKDSQEYLRKNAKLVSGSYNVNTPGEYKLVYSLTNSAGKVSYLEVTVIVKDLNQSSGKPPQITLLGDGAISLPLNSRYNEPGYIILDEVEGELPPNHILVRYFEGFEPINENLVSSVDTSSPGVFLIQYIAINSHGYSATAQRFVFVTNNGKAPSLTLKPYPTGEDGTLADGSFVVLEAGVNEYTEYGITAIDEEDGMLGESSIFISGEVRNLPGEYKIYYSATDSDGNVAILSRTIRVLDALPPVVVLKPNIIQSQNYNYNLQESEVIHLKQNLDFIERPNDFLLIDEGDPDLASRIKDDFYRWVTITYFKIVDGIKTPVSSIDSGVIGEEYIISYIFEDMSGNKSEPVERKVRIIDGIRPDIEFPEVKKIAISQDFKIVGQDIPADPKQSFIDWLELTFPVSYTDNSTAPSDLISRISYYGIRIDADSEPEQILNYQVYDKASSSYFADEDVDICKLSSNYFDDLYFDRDSIHQIVEDAKVEENLFNFDEEKEFMTYYLLSKDNRSEINRRFYVMKSPVILDKETPSEEADIRFVQNNEAVYPLRWESVTGADYYEVYRKGKSGDFQFLAKVEDDLTYFIEDYNYHVYRVKAFAESGGFLFETGYSQEVVLYRMSLIDEFNASVKSSFDTISVSWNNSEGVDGYELYHAYSDNPGILGSTYNDFSKVKATYDLTVNLYTVGDSVNKAPVQQNYFWIRPYIEVEGVREYGQQVGSIMGARDLTDEEWIAEINRSIYHAFSVEATYTRNEEDPEVKSLVPLHEPGSTWSDNSWTRGNVFGGYLAGYNNHWDTDYSRGYVLQGIRPRYLTINGLLADLYYQNRNFWGVDENWRSVRISARSAESGASEFLEISGFYPGEIRYHMHIDSTKADAVGGPCIFGDGVCTHSEHCTMKAEFDYLWARKAVPGFSWTHINYPYQIKRNGSGVVNVANTPEMWAFYP
ncbi:MAG: DUF5011 domain-containing protein [Spirochaetales bacterium]|nr:DUF5011 domain-containing protein [Spirochaetales bacterium]